MNRALNSDSTDWEPRVRVCSMDLNRPVLVYPLLVPVKKYNVSPFGSRTQKLR